MFIRTHQCSSYCSRSLRRRMSLLLSYKFPTFAKITQCSYRNALDGIRLNNTCMVPQHSDLAGPYKLRLLVWWQSIPVNRVQVVTILVTLAIIAQRTSWHQNSYSAYLGSINIETPILQ